MTNYYDILGVDKEATLSDIKKSYRRRSKELHPDIGGDPELFKELNKCYAILGVPRLREKYDNGEDPEKKDDEFVIKFLDEFDAVVRTLVASKSVKELKECKVLEEVKINLINSIKGGKSVIKKMKVGLPKYEALRDKFTVKDKAVNILKEVIINEINNINKVIDSQNSDIDILEQAVSYAECFEELVEEDPEIEWVVPAFLQAGFNSST